MKTIFSLIFFLYFTAVTGQNINIQNEISDHAQSGLLKHAQWSLYAEYIDNGEVIINYNSDFSLAPASCLKLFTTAAAYNYLGKDFKFETGIYSTGLLTNGILNGNLIIKGGGDPTLGSNLVEDSLPLDSLMDSWISKIKDAGIKQINGSIIADANLFDNFRVSGQWYWIDLGNYYGAQTSALNINDNLYYLYLQPSKNAGEPAEFLRIEPIIPGLEFENKMLTGEKGSGDNGYVYCAPNQYNAVLRGTVPAGFNEFSIKGSIPNPPLFAAQYLKSGLLKNGIPVNGTPQTAGEKIDYEKAFLITKTSSPALEKIVYIINKKSFNLYTEVLLKMTALQEYGNGSIENGTYAVNQLLNNYGADTSGINMFDGCGLSRSDAITAKAMVKLLAGLTKESFFNSFYNTLGIAGKKDDLSSFRNWGSGTAIENNARIKSGTIGGVKSHSGYVKDKSGRMIAFSFIANNFHGSSGKISAIHRQILIDLANLK